LNSSTRFSSGNTIRAWASAARRPQPPRVAGRQIPTGSMAPDGLPSPVKARIIPPVGRRPRPYSPVFPLRPASKLLPKPNIAYPWGMPKVPARIPIWLASSPRRIFEDLFLAMWILPLRAEGSEVLQNKATQLTNGDTPSPKPRQRTCSFGSLRSPRVSALAAISSRSPESAPQLLQHARTCPGLNNGPESS
jgi:hypothetical protein